MAQSKKALLAPVKTLLDQRMPDIKDALPSIGLTPERMARIALTTIAKGDMRLMQACAADPPAVYNAIMEAAQLGLTLDGPLGQAYLAPRKRKGKQSVQMMLGYKGKVVLAVRSGVVAHVAAGVVKEGDFFQYEMGSGAYLRHVPHDKHEKRGLPTHVYAVAHLQAGGPPPFVVLTTHEVKRYQDMADGNSAAWREHWETMAKKTAISRLCDGSKFPLSAELGEAKAREEEPRDIVLPAQSRVIVDEPDEDGVVPDPPEAAQLDEHEQEPEPPPSDDDEDYGQIPF